MLFSSVALAGAFIAACSASPVTSPHVVHEKRELVPHGWEKRNAVRRDLVLPMRIGMVQNNLDKGDDWLMEVSHPESSKYGQHWTAKQIAEAFAPSHETVNSIHEWLTSAGIPAERIEQSQSLNWLTFHASVDEAESLLKTKYHVYEHATTGQAHVACDEYSIPQQLQSHVDFVYPTLHFDAKLKSPKDDGYLSKRDLEARGADNLGRPGSGSLPKLGKLLGSKWQSIWQELENCDNQIVPDCLRALYEFPPNFVSSSKNSYGIVEYTPQAYVPADLDMFFQNFSTRQVGNRPILDSIDGGVVQQSNMGFGYNGESDLDLEYAMALVYPQKVTLYQVGDTVEGASFNNFLDAIDGSYCTYQGGDSPVYDGTYPDPLPGGYQGPENCGGFAATKVISTSYAANEHDLPASYEQRQCHEYMKLGLMGVSVLYSSGDYGVAGNGGQCINGPGPNAPYQDGSLGGRFNPSFPGTCPYITSVGATQVIPGTNIVKALASGTEPEQACETVIFSGGGFSNVFPLPGYQSAAVKSYFQHHLPPYSSSRYNNSRTTRGFPDISANGANYVVAVDGQFALVYGTSASSPALGSVFTLINEARFAVGKGSIGFVNPVAYAHPEVFNDITKGTNQGCATQGFSAVPGWDPVTGLGTPNFPKMVKLWLSMP